MCKSTSEPDTGLPDIWYSIVMAGLIKKMAFVCAQRAYLALAAALLGGLPTITTAQTVASAQQTDEEMIITARKKEELLIEIPVAVSAFDINMIDNLGLNRIDDIAGYTPGFSFNTGLGRQPTSDRPTVRGLTTVRNGIANASVATVFVDGIYVGGSSQSTELYNLERIEVLRGPQSALYGRNTYAGAINYVTRKPTKALTGEVRVTGAEHDTAGITGWLSGPLIEDKLGFMIAAGHSQYGGEYRNTRDGSSVGGEQSSDVTAKLRWTPTDALDITLKAGLQETDDEHFAVFMQGREWNNCCFRSDGAPRAREYFVGDSHKTGDINLYTDLLDTAGGAGSKLERQLVSLSIDWDSPGGYTLTSVTGYVDDELRRGIDSSYAAYDPLPLFPPMVPVDMRGSFTKVDWIEQSDFSQELRLRSPESHSLRWTTGLYYYRGEANTIASNQVFINNMTTQTVIAPVTTPLMHDEINNFAAFGGTEWDFIDRWTLSAEIRWATDKVSVRNTQSYPAVCNAPDEFTTRFTSLTPRFTLSHAATEDLHYYVNIAKGIKPGDFNTKVPELPGGCPDENFRSVDEERVWNYEMGVKGQWWQRRITSNIAMFYLDVEDQQLTQIIELANGDNASIIRNVGRTSVYGFESELGTALTENLSMDISYAWTRAEYRDHISTDEADLRGSNGSLADNDLLGDVSGNLVPRVPEHMASLVIRYEQPLGGDRLWYISGNYTFESSRYAQEHNLIETGDRSLIGLRTGFNTRRWEASVWVKNLFDDDTPVDIQRFLDRRSGSLARCTTFPSAVDCDNSSRSPRGFVITLPRGRQAGAALSFRF